MKTLDQIIKKLPAERRAKIASRAEALIAEEIALRHLRKARRLTQERMAQLLGIGQDSVSRLESRSDLLLSTLKSYVEAMGGSLKLVVEFPDSAAVLSSLGEAGDRKKPRPSRQKTSRGRRRLSLAHAND
jgi:transcriptional regulator with XRE-family HTH domain